MLDQEVLSDGRLNDDQKRVLKKVCEKIYILETTVDSSQMPSQIAGEIKLFAGDYAS